MDGIQLKNWDPNNVVPLSLLDISKLISPSTLSDKLLNDEEYKNYMTTAEVYAQRIDQSAATPEEMLLQALIAYRKNEFKSMESFIINEKFPETHLAVIMELYNTSYDRWARMNNVPTKMSDRLEFMIIDDRITAYRSRLLEEEWHQRKMNPHCSVQWQKLEMITRMDRSKLKAEYDALDNAKKQRERDNIQFTSAVRFYVERDGYQCDSGQIPAEDKMNSANFLLWNLFQDDLFEHWIPNAEEYVRSLAQSDFMEMDLTLQAVLACRKKDIDTMETLILDDCFPPTALPIVVRMYKNHSNQMASNDNMLLDVRPLFMAIDTKLTAYIASVLEEEHEIREKNPQHNTQWVNLENATLIRSNELVTKFCKLAAAKKKAKTLAMKEARRQQKNSVEKSKKRVKTPDDEATFSSNQRKSGDDDDENEPTSSKMPERRFSMVGQPPFSIAGQPPNKRRKSTRFYEESDEEEEEEEKVKQKESPVESDSSVDSASSLPSIESKGLSDDIFEAVLQRVEEEMKQKLEAERQQQMDDLAQKENYRRRMAAIEETVEEVARQPWKPEIVFVRIEVPPRIENNPLQGLNLDWTLPPGCTMNYKKWSIIQMADWVFSVTNYQYIRETIIREDMDGDSMSAFLEGPETRHALKIKFGPWRRLQKAAQIMINYPNNV